MWKPFLGVSVPKIALMWKKAPGLYAKQVNLAKLTEHRIDKDILIPGAEKFLLLCHDDMENMY